MSHQQYQQRFQPPELYAISRGIVSKIESYGCFVKLHNSPVSGLVHISQLYSTKIDNVTDVVSLDMEVWVKVISIQVETIEDETTGRTRQRHKVKLSMKYVNQDTGQDLDPENENIENDMQRSSRGGGGRGGMSAGNVMDGTNGANSQLGQALSSNIGMSIAMDPGNLVLKGKRGAASAAINGYSLVKEDEGEVPNNNADHQESIMPVKQKVVRPMGRGRGTTLPAWMTRVDSEDKLGTMNALPKDDDNGSRGSDRHRSKSRRDDKHKHRKERRSKKYHKKHKSRKHKDHRSSKGGRSRSYSYSSYSSTSRSRSRSRSTERRSSKHKKKRKSHKRHKRRRHNRSDSRSRSHSSREDISDFTNVDEARAIMQRLEKRRVEADS